ncbi:hypothetical protein [Dielma fastidiosa]|uniref:Uncharacterized protein n=1 Tax=Dielma fastidiosa TaxID=1034346 RepID=A0A318KPJ1_9FIRM|nr:hypothetical protein [Dielma fastidiosa]PXX79731.1 hypothetical protein DES51_105205 [Dielma fastidiosa]
MSKPKKKDVILGSGKLYHKEFTGVIPENEEIETEENLVGAIKGGATVTYTPTLNEETSDLNEVTVVIFNSDEAIFKSGLMTLIGDTFKLLTSTARVSEKDGVETVLIGGVGNHDGKTHLFHFVNSNPLRPVRATVVGVNQKGFELAFKQDGATVVDLEVKGEALDDAGTKIKLQLGNKVEVAA